MPQTFLTKLAFLTFMFELDRIEAPSNLTRDGLQKNHFFGKEPPAMGIWRNNENDIGSAYGKPFSCCRIACGCDLYRIQMKGCSNSLLCNSNQLRGTCNTVGLLDESANQHAIFGSAKQST